MHRQEGTSVPHSRRFYWVTCEHNEQPQDIPLLFLPRNSQRVMRRQWKYSQTGTPSPETAQWGMLCFTPSQVLRAQWLEQRPCTSMEQKAIQDLNTDSNSLNCILLENGKVYWGNVPKSSACSSTLLWASVIRYHVAEEGDRWTPVWPSTATSILFEPKLSLQFIFYRTFRLLNDKCQISISTIHFSHHPKCSEQEK